MKLFIFLLFPAIIFGQLDTKYNASPDYPFGRLNPEAPKEVADFTPLIGTCDCVSTARKADQSWGDSQKMTWTFKYIMNGTAVQDETIKEDGSHSGSIRQFIADSSKWYVHWYSNKTPSTTLPTWEGSKTGDNIILYREQKAPNGMDGFFRLTFKDITDSGFSWLGEWVDKAEKIVYPTWTIECKKKTQASDLETITTNTLAFSKAYMDADYKKLAGFYSEDGKIFPSGTDIITGRADIEKRWILPEGYKTLYHKVTPSEVKIIGDYAYDYGYYEGRSLNPEKEESFFKGKYVIVWKKVASDWKIYLDIWNKL